MANVLTLLNFLKYVIIINILLKTYFGLFNISAGVWICYILQIKRMCMVEYRRLDLNSFPMHVKNLRNYAFKTLVWQVQNQKDVFEMFLYINRCTSNYSKFSRGLRSWMILQRTVKVYFVYIGMKFLRKVHIFQF